jgi:hypothetical protein
MANPYLDNQPEPTPAVEAKSNWLWLVAAIALAGLFLPPAGGWQFDVGPKPEPTPIPDPTPIIDTKPDPAKTEGSWVIVVEQTEARTPAIARIMSDTPYWQSLIARGLNWRHYDADAADAEPFAALANKVGLPAVLILGGKGFTDANGKGIVYAKFPLTTKEALDTGIKEATGR